MYIVSIRISRYLITSYAYTSSLLSNPLFTPRYSYFQNTLVNLSSSNLYYTLILSSTSPFSISSLFPSLNLSKTFMFPFPLLPPFLQIKEYRNAFNSLNHSPSYLFLIIITSPRTKSHTPSASKGI